MTVVSVPTMSVRMRMRMVVSSLLIMNMLFFMGLVSRVVIVSSVRLPVVRVVVSSSSVVVVVAPMRMIVPSPSPCPVHVIVSTVIMIVCGSFDAASRGSN